MRNLKNIITRPRDLLIIIGLMMTIDCVSSFCGLVHVEGLTYGHAIILRIVLSCGECINITVTGVNLAKYCTKELGPDEDKDNLLKPDPCVQLCHLSPSTAILSLQKFLLRKQTAGSPTPQPLTKATSQCIHIRTKNSPLET